MAGRTPALTLKAVLMQSAVVMMQLARSKSPGRAVYQIQEPMTGRQTIVRKEQPGQLIMAPVLQVM